MDHENSGKAQFYRLPKDVQPIHYEISLEKINLENFTYSGKQKVIINVIKPTKKVILNSVDIRIKNASYSNKNQESSEQHSLLSKKKEEITLTSQNVKYNTSEETVSINFEKEIPLGKDGHLMFEFEGRINEKLNGFYRSKYISDGVTKFAAVTQFAPTDARRCFPCWDEPAVKATFDISLTVSKGLTAISNMPIKSVNENNLHMVTVDFEKTPVMSTYLVAFMVCDYGFLKKKINNKIIRLYAPKDKIKDGEFGLDVAVKALSFYESYFNISYPLSKLDMITVADFSFGAMENWGLITYREAILFVDSKNSSIVNKQKIALTVAHELAHQWFGNLVTMEWWTHLWLNEGYASFMQYMCINQLYPEYNIWTQFLISTFIKALELDALANTHPIEVPVGNPSEITEIFDQISYSKGASIIRMIHNYIGADDFQKGMTLYLNRHSYSNVETEDLWRALEEVSNKSINEIMSTWTKLPGFPLVSIIEKDSSNPNNRIFTFSQERFYINGSVDKTNTTWIIPITLSSALNPEKILKVIILDEKSKDIEIEDISKQTWIKVNVGTIGFFRTLYSNELLKMLLTAIQEQSLPASDRLGLLDDLFATAQSGRASTVEFLKLLKEFKNENEFTVWSCIVNNLRKINNILSQVEDTNRNFRIFGKNLLFKIHLKLGWTPKENEDHLETLLRILVLSQLVDFEDEATIREAQRRFQMHITKESILPADFRSFIYQAVLSVGNSETFEQMLSLYRETSMHEERNRILSSLGAIKDANILQRILEFSMSDEVRTQDAVRVIRSVTMSQHGKLLAWKYFKDNWKVFVERCQSGTLLTHIVEAVTESFVSDDIIQDIQEFFKKNPISGTERTIRQSIETIKLNVAWLNRDKESIKGFLNPHKGD